MPNLIEWIEAQLKRGYTRQQIKNALVKHGHPPTVVAQVDKIKVSVNKKTPIKPLLLGGLVILILVSFFIFYNQKSPQTNVIPIEPRAGPAETSSEVEILQNQKTIKEELCDEFDEFNSCLKAVKLALSDTPGVIEDVSIGPMRIPNPSGYNPIFVQKNLWLIDIILENPYFNEVLGKEIKNVRVGIGINEDIGIHRKPLLK